MEGWIITFPSVAHAWRAERLLRNAGYQVKLIAVPRSLTNCCEGLAALVDAKRVKQAVELLEQQQVFMLHKGIQIKLD